jgi:hypothetical protein
MSEPSQKDDVFIYLDSNSGYFFIDDLVKMVSEEFSVSNEQATVYFMEWSDL